MLKKSAIALAVAAAIAAPMAQAADVYGKVEVTVTSAKDMDLAVEEYGRLGVKGSSDLNNGMKAGYKLEFNVSQLGDQEYCLDADDNPVTPDICVDIKSEDSGAGKSTALGKIGLRHANVSLSGGFGTVTIGRQSNPYADTYVADQFENYTGDFEQSSFRFGNAVIWNSNDMGGMDFYAGAVMEDTNKDGDDMDATVIGFNGDFSGIGVHAGVVSSGEDGTFGKESLTSIGVDYTMGKLYLAGNFETASEKEVDVIELAALYDLSGTTKVGVGLSTCEDDTGTTCKGKDEETRITMGGYFDMGNNVATWAEYGSRDEADTNYVQVGMRVKF